MTVYMNKGFIKASRNILEIHYGVCYVTPKLLKLLKIIQISEFCGM